MTNWPKFRFIKNEKEKIAKIYEEYVGRHITQYYERVPDEITYEIFNNKSNKVWKGLQSWFSPRVPSNGCVHWHADMDEDRWPSALISVFDSATQIAIPKTPIAEEYMKSHNWDYFGCMISNSRIDDLVKAGDFEIFTPELGDIYWLAPKVIHRSNPNCYGKPRLCLRIWNPQDVL